MKVLWMLLFDWQSMFNYFYDEDTHQLTKISVSTEGELNIWEEKQLHYEGTHFRSFCVNYVDRPTVSACLQFPIVEAMRFLFSLCSGRLFVCYLFVCC